MEQPKASTKPKSKILKFLPRATSSVSFQNPQLYSPVKEKRSSEKAHKSNLGKGFSGPLVTMVPSDNRRKVKNNDDSSFALVFEPTSPRVSCMGQVKCKHAQKLLAKSASKVSRTTSFNPVTTYNKQHVEKDIEQEKVTKVGLEDVKIKKKSGFRSIFGGGSRSKKCVATNDKSKTTLDIPKAPTGLGTMKRFSSGRDAFANFEWTTQVAPLDSARANYFTDGESDCERDDEIKIPSSAPVMARNKGVCDDFVRVGGVNLQPKKEINLWKRRTMAQPKPLQLHVE